jgi:hypothetical protein
MEQKPAAYATQVERACLPELCFTPDVSTACLCSRRTAQIWMQTGRIPSKRIGKRWVTTREALLEALSPRFAPLRLVSHEGGTR